MVKGLQRSSPWVGRAPKGQAGRRGLPQNFSWPPYFALHASPPHGKGGKVPWLALHTSRSEIPLLRVTQLHLASGFPSVKLHALLGECREMVRGGG